MFLGHVTRLNRSVGVYLKVRICTEIAGNIQVNMNSKQVRKTIEAMVTDMLVDRRRITVTLAVVVTVVLAFFIPDMIADPTLKSGVDTSAAAYRHYEKFLDVFGSEEFILIAVKNKRPSDDPAILKGLAAITEGVENLKTVNGVVSLSTLKVFGEKKGFFGSYDLLHKEGSQLKLADAADLNRIRTALPVFDFLLSRDLRTYGLLVRLDDKWRYDVPVIDETLQKINAIVRSHLTPGAEFRVVGAPLIRLAIQKYNVQTAIIFGILCLVIATSVSFYIFKSLRVTMITMVVMVMCVSWILSFMALVKIPLNSTTGLSFGLVLIVSVAAVIRIVTPFQRTLSLHKRPGRSCQTSTVRCPGPPASCVPPQPL